MDRRQVLKNLGYGAGFLVATPTVISLLQSCSNEPDWQPTFLSVGQGFALKQIVDLILNGFVAGLTAPYGPPIIMLGIIIPGP